MSPVFQLIKYLCRLPLIGKISLIYRTLVLYIGKRRQPIDAFITRADGAEYRLLNYPVHDFNYIFRKFSFPI